MELYKCDCAVRIPPDKKQFVEEAIARFIEAEARIRSPIFMEVTLQLDEYHQVTEMRARWRVERDNSNRPREQMTFSRAIGLNGQLCCYSRRIGIKISPFYSGEIVNTFRFYLSRIPTLNKYITIKPYQIPPNYIPMKLVVSLHPNSNEGKNLLANFITDCLGESDNDWFALRLNITIDPRSNAVQSLYVGTGWQTPQWAEMRDRGPSFAEKERFQSFFSNWFKTAGISTNPTTPEAVLRFFEVMLKHCPELSEYFAIIEK